MRVIIQVVALLCCGLFAGILLGDRMGASFARPELSDSSFLQFQQIQHVHFVRLMPPLMLGAFIGGLAWLIMARGSYPQVWILALAVIAMMVGAALTLRINIPINNQMMTWSVTAPPPDMREIWARWEKFHTIRTSLWVVAFLLETLAAAI
jgi:hypothetical protein